MYTYKKCAGLCPSGMFIGIKVEEACNSILIINQKFEEIRKHLVNGTVKCQLYVNGRGGGGGWLGMGFKIQP